MALGWLFSAFRGRKKLVIFSETVHDSVMKRTGNDRFVAARLAPTFRLLTCGCVGLGLALGAFAAPAGGQEETFKLREASAFEKGDDRDSNFLRGQMGQCRTAPDPEVKAYPSFKSGKPIYGSVRFAAQAREPASGVLYHFAIDESRGTGKGYDLLYFDLNRDLDLRNDPVLKPQSRPPDSARQHYSNIKQQVLFDFLSVEFDFGPAGSRPVQLLPRLVVSVYDQEEYQQMSFVRARLCEGDIKIGGKDYQARLGNDYSVRGRLDDPGTAMVLTPKDRSSRADWWGGDRLMAAHKIQGKFYTFSASPTGDQLTVRPYTGDLGTFAIGPGGRNLDTLTVSGSLESKEHAVAVGGELEEGSLKAAQRCQIPVGDYSPNYITVRFGRLQIKLSENYHSDGKPRDRGGHPRVYGITVRQDRPYVLDFANKPDVMFASPAREQRIKAGATIEVKAVLVDPQLDIMIRGLDDTSRRQTKDAQGQPVGYRRNLSLDPTVLITRANGEKVAEGVMPFG